MELATMDTINFKYKNELVSWRQELVRKIFYLQMTFGDLIIFYYLFYKHSIEYKEMVKWFIDRKSFF